MRRGTSLTVVLRRMLHIFLLLPGNEAMAGRRSLKTMLHQTLLPSSPEKRSCTTNTLTEGSNIMLITDSDDFLQVVYFSLCHLNSTPENILSLAVAPLRS